MKRILSLALAALMLCGAIAVPSAGASGELRAIAESTIIVADGFITRVAGIPTAAGLKAQLVGDGEITVVGVADGESVPNGTTVTCGEAEYTAVISGDLHADAKLNARDVTVLMHVIVSGDIADPAADVDLDEKVNARDVTTLMKHLVGWDVVVGAEFFAYSEEPIAAPAEDETLSLFFGDNLTKKDKDDNYADGAPSDLIRLAKNEIEFTQFFLTTETDRGDLTVTATDFVSLKGEVMESELLAEHYFDVKDAATGMKVRYADALPPAELYPFKIANYESQGFVIKAKSSADTPAGLYRAKISVKNDAGDTVKRADVYARVWDFTLSDETECATRVRAVAVQYLSLSPPVRPGRRRALPGLLRFPARKPHQRVLPAVQRARRSRRRIYVEPARHVLYDRRARSPERWADRGNARLDERRGAFRGI